MSRAGSYDVGGMDEVGRNFDKMDKNRDGVLELQEIKPFVPAGHHDRLERDFQNADTNGDGVLSPREFQKLAWKVKAYRFAQAIVQPKTDRARPVRGQYQVQDHPEGLTEIDGSYTKQYTCVPPPIFMFSITLAMIGIFAYHTNEIIEKIGPIGINGPPPMDSVLIYDPYKRHEAWRFLTYMFVHAGWVHITSNVVMQLFLGILLEMVHQWWRVLIVYCLGVIAGSLATSITDPKVFLAGASGGVYALITAHMATVIMNWEDMEMPWVRVISFTAFTFLDVGTALYYRYVDPVDQKVGYAAHFGGALIGLLVGIFVLRNIEPKACEKKLQWIAALATVILMSGAIAWNLFYPEHFPSPRYA